MSDPWDATTRGMMRAHRIEPVLLLDLFVDTTSLHCASTFVPMIGWDVGDGVSRDYEALESRWSVGDDFISMGSGLSPEPLNINFDASRAGDDSDFVGRFVDAAWHRRRARLTIVAAAVGSGRATLVRNIISWEGEMDFRTFPETENAPQTMILTIESGTFRYLGRNAQTRTDENQQRFFPGDIFFQDLPGLIGRELPWHRDWV